MVAGTMVTVIWEDLQSIYISTDFVLIYINYSHMSHMTVTVVCITDVHIQQLLRYMSVIVFYIPKMSYTSFYTLPKYCLHNLCENCNEGLLFKKFMKKIWETVSPPLGYIEALQI